MEINEIKTFYRTHVSKGKIFTLDELTQLLAEYEYSDTEFNELTQWFYNIHNFEYLNLLSPFEEIIIHHPQNICYLSEKMKTQQSGPLSTEDHELSLLILTLKEQKNWNYRNPFSSFLTHFNQDNRNQDNKNQKYRITLIHHSTLPDRCSKIFIRSIAPQIFPLKSYTPVRYNNEVYLNSYLEKLVKSKKNILICGSTGSGKTSLINSMASRILKNEHVVIIEDTSEIQLLHPFTTRMLATDQENKSMEDYLAYAMRMSPDRIIVGEIRSKEVIPYLLALNTGHKGCLTTIHANNAIDALHRIALLYCIYGKGQLDYYLILKLVCNNIDSVIFMENKQITEVCKIFGSENGNIIFESMIGSDDISSNRKN